MRTLTALWYASENSTADYVLLAVRFPKETRFILAKSHPKATQAEALEEMIEDHVEPLGFVHISLHRKNEVEWTLTYRAQPFAQYEHDGRTKEFLDALQLQCALALDDAGIIKLLPAN